MDLVKSKLFFSMKESKFVEIQVQKYMNEMGLQAIYPRPNTSKENLVHQIYHYNYLKI
ncbi:hypothetical protein CULT_2330006 [[Clostridium] ultunense Esp]|nr:hypothetical protein CULT_2330006 [[Clostridium] ultunense Esp]